MAVSGSATIGIAFSAPIRSRLLMGRFFQQPGIDIVTVIFIITEILVSIRGGRIPYNVRMCRRRAVLTAL